MMDFEDENPLLSSMLELEEENLRNSMEDTRNPAMSRQLLSGMGNPNITSATSINSSNDGSELIQSFRNLREDSGISTDSAGDALSSIEVMPHNKLVKFSKDLFNIMETYSIKHNDTLGLDAPGGLMESLSGNHFGTRRPESSNDLRNRGSVFVRQHRPGSGETYKSTASIASMARAPVANTTTVSRGNDEEGNKTINEYSVIADLGKGAFAKVKLGQNNVSGQVVAIKIIKKSNINKALRGAGQDNYAMLQREIAIMKKLRHKNIVALYEVIDDPSADKLYLVMQYVDNGPIIRVRPDFTCEPLDEQKIVKYLRQLCSGLRYLHKRNVVHRDIKPDNILVGNDGTVYLADFGVSEITESVHHTIRGVQGTPVFLAPEVLREDPHADGIAADVWALGVTLYLMLFGVAPFIGKNFAEIAENIKNKPVMLPVGSPVTHRWKDILHGMLEKNPAKRMTLSQLKTHKIFMNVMSADISSIPLSKRELTGALRNCKMFLADDDDDAQSPTNITSATAKRLQMAINTRMIVAKFMARIRAKVAARGKPKPTMAFAENRAASFHSGPPSGRKVGVRGLLPQGPPGQPQPPRSPATGGRQSPATARLLSTLQNHDSGSASAGKKPQDKPIHLPQLNLKKGIPVGAPRRRL